MRRGVSLVFIVVLLSTLSCHARESTASTTRCSPEPTIEALVASWAEESEAHMLGRREIRVLMNQKRELIRVPIEGEEHELVALPIALKDIRTAEKLAARLNAIIAIDLVAEASEERADLYVSAVCEPAHKSDYGIVSSDSSGKKLLMLINTCSELYTKTKGSFGPIFLHELGHVLGLEHPFDASDGDCMLSREPFDPKGAHTGHTLMAYREDPTGEVPRFYTETDLKALIRIWGAQP